jgi:hypothetical protein
MKKDWSKLSPADRNRLGACFFHLNADYRKSIMGKGVRIDPSTSSSLHLSSSGSILRIATLTLTSDQLDQSSQRLQAGRKSH